MTRAPASRTAGEPREHDVDPESPTSSPLRSVHTAGVPELLDRLSSSLLISTYQTGKLICARTHDGTLNTHFRDFDRPMGLAVTGDRIALGTRSQVWDFRNVPAAAPKADPPGQCDACFVALSQIRESATFGGLPLEGASQ